MWELEGVSLFFFVMSERKPQDQSVKKEAWHVPREPLLSEAGPTETKTRALYCPADRKVPRERQEAPLHPKEGKK
jgi:hypothetical protein